jgi:hypothetical protein
VTIPGTNPASRALSEAVQCLEPYASDGRFTDLIRKLQSLQVAYEGEHADGVELAEPDYNGDAGELAKALEDAESLSKSEEIGPAIRERADRAAKSLALDHLHRMSPAAARAYETRQSV